MAIWDIFKAREAAGARAQGRITDLRVEKDGQAERWLFRLDSRPGEEFVFEPTPLSPPRRRGEQVVVYVGPARAGEPRPAERIATA